MDFSPYNNDESLCRRRRRVKDTLNDESFTEYFPFYPDAQTFTDRGICFRIYNVSASEIIYTS